MARRKGKAARGKRHVPQARTGRIEDELLATAGRSVMTIWRADESCPLCAPTSAEQGPYGRARATVQASVSPVPLDTV